MNGDPYKPPTKKLIGLYMFHCCNISEHNSILVGWGFAHSLCPGVGIRPFKKFSADLPGGMVMLEIDWYITYIDAVW